MSYAQSLYTKEALLQPVGYDERFQQPPAKVNSYQALKIRFSAPLVVGLTEGSGDFLGVLIRREDRAENADDRRVLGDERVRPVPSSPRPADPGSG